MNKVVNAMKAIPAVSAKMLLNPKFLLPATAALGTVAVPQYRKAKKAKEEAAKNFMSARQLAFIANIYRSRLMGMTR